MGIMQSFRDAAGGRLRPSWNVARFVQRELRRRGWKVSRRIAATASGSMYLDAWKAGRAVQVRISDHPHPRRNPARTVELLELPPHQRIARHALRELR